MEISGTELTDPDGDAFELWAALVYNDHRLKEREREERNLMGLRVEMEII